ncbi:hypothetical protein ACSBPH_04150 [Microbacterium sp. F51-2R]|uniref:hypothetical protein n=1 Tax=Microbacterium sp. F51-2R TaxID=3445777 RepID=UPI003F9EFADE
MSKDVFRNVYGKGRHDGIQIGRAQLAQEIATAISEAQARQRAEGRLRLATVAVTTMVQICLETAKVRREARRVAAEAEAPTAS